MYRLNRKALSMGLILALIACLLPRSSAMAEEGSLTTEQENAIAMLNYITVLTQEINDSKNSRVYMEEAYSSLINNTYPNAVDGRTLLKMTGLLDTMEGYRMIGVKRDRLKYIYDQSQAQAIRAAIPNPEGLISAVVSQDPVKIVASIAYMAVDSYTSYAAYTSKAEQQYLQDGWTLDDEEAEKLHLCRKGAFEYMVNMVNDYAIPGELALTEDTVSEFVEYKNSSNIASKIRFLESNKSTYQHYGGYWLALADGYYSNSDYEKCLQAVATYEDMNTRIFRRDYEYANVLPLAIAAASKTYDDKRYEEYASNRAQSIVDNTGHDEWALRYFVEQTLVDLYARTGERNYLRRAYEVTLDSVNYLVGEQQSQNSTYLSEVKEKDIPKDADDSEDADEDVKTSIEDYNKMLHETRMTEVPPISEPLELNCDMLFAIANELKLNDAEKSRIDSILHPDDKPLYLVESIDDRYWFGEHGDEPMYDNPAVMFAGTAIIMPVNYVTSSSSIEVSIKGPDDKEPTVIDDWKVEEVKRGKEGDISTFEVSFTSEAAHKQHWVPDSEIVVTITPEKGDTTSYTCAFKAKGTKDQWFDWLKVWEGQKNNWWDYLKFWENSVVFEREE